MENVNNENIKLLFYEGINFLQFQIELLAEKNENLKNYTYIQYIEKNTPLIVNETITKIINKDDFTEKVTKLANIFTDIKDYMQLKVKEIENSKLYITKELQDVFTDYTNMLFNNLDSFDLHESFKGWTEDGTIYNTRAEERIISSHRAGTETLLLNHFAENLDKFTWQLADLLDEFLQLTKDNNREEKPELNKEIMTNLIKMKDDFKVGDKKTFLYKNSNGNIWELTIRREEEIYEPFKFAIVGTKVGTNQTWSRRYTDIKKALLHIVNDFNENANIKNRYSNIEEYLNEKIKLIYKYEENGNYYYEDENENLYCENGNQNVGEICLMYCTKEYGEPICEVENLEKYELVNNPKNNPNYERKKANEYNYMMLDRLRSDCDYFLGNGNGFLGHLYYKDIDKHIEEMKKIYEAFSNEEKPEWISLEDINNYKERMCEMLEKNEEEEI
ncbi:LPD11 domain-containing protein [uncultured Clostridium sp.]|uniref:LPD11 domain-containing protein n=1 Tax=uncultured Clostridium sp. TaxID=59620 RepID=UPI00272AA479|nr:LPD11 domain-containing protein [uncultured Clostridium sp.]